MQPPNVLGSENVDQTAALHMSYLDKTWLKCQNVWMEDGESLRIAFPSNSPIWSRARQPFLINKERVIGVAEQETRSQDARYGSV